MFLSLNFFWRTTNKLNVAVEKTPLQSIILVLVESFTSSIRKSEIFNWKESDNMRRHSACGMLAASSLRLVVGLCL